MPQNWKMLGAVAMVAGAAGWFAMRLLIAPVSHESRNDELAPAASEDADATTASEPGAAPTSERASAPEAGAPPSAEAQVAVDDRDLLALQAALRLDRYLDERLFPAGAGIAAMPGVIPYRRALDFWQPAIRPKTERQ